MFSPRIKAFLIHLGLSLLILLALLYVIVYIWYPPPFFAADGGWQGIQLIVGVDLVLGPLLTLAVFNINKPARLLRRDLAIIGVIQIFALTAGTWIVADQRTRLVLHVNDHFLSLTEVLIEESGATPEILQSLQGRKPAMGMVELPEDPVSRDQFVTLSSKSRPLHTRSDLYRPLTPEALKSIAKRGFDLMETAAALPELKPRVEEFIRKSGRSNEQLAAVPVYCRYGNPSIVIDRETGEMLETININHDQLLSTVIVRKRKERERQKAEAEAATNSG